MKKSWIWATGVIVLGVVVLVGARQVKNRQAASATAAAAAAAPAPSIELATSDLAQASEQALLRRIEVSGGLTALNSALVKSRIAAEVREVLVREGDSVKAGQVVVRLDDTEVAWRLRQAEDQAAAAQAQLDIAERSLANNRALVDQGFISRNALETSASSVAGAQATLQAARAAAELARKSVRDAVLTAPLAGQVSQRLAQPGERVGVDARLLEIVDLSKVELVAALAAADAGAVLPGQTVRLDIEGVGQGLSGRVARLNPGTQAGTRAVLAYIGVDAVPGLRQGLFARGAIEVERRNALVVPLSALRVDQGRPYVLAVVDGQVQQRQVEPGVRGEAQFGGAPESAVELRSGLDAGARVLRGSVGALRSGTPVTLP